MVKKINLCLSLFLLLQASTQLQADTENPTFEVLMNASGTPEQQTWAERTRAWIVSVLHDMHKDDYAEPFNNAFRKELLEAKPLIVRGAQSTATQFNRELRLQELPYYVSNRPIIIKTLTNYINNLSHEDYGYLRALANICNTTPEAIIFNFYQRKNGNLAALDTVMMFYVLHNTPQGAVSETQQATFSALKTIAQQRLTLERKKR